MLSVAGCDEAAEMDGWGGDDDARSASLAAEPDAQANHNVNKIGTNNSGAAYKAECSANSVPVPAKVLDPADSRWQNHGVLANPILNPTLDAELWTYQDGLGLCMALPRWNSQDKAEFLGLICVGRTTGISCFWDNPKGTLFSRNVAINIDSFVGGFALEANGQGRCTKCDVVLPSAVGTAPWSAPAGPLPPTMPPEDPGDSDDLYECSTLVTVRGRMNATLTLYVEGNQVATAVQKAPEGHVFKVAPLVQDDVIEATQTVGTDTSGKGSAEVLDKDDAFPDGLPAPVINPTPIYECATAIAFMQVPGATAQVEKDPMTGATKTYSKASGVVHTWFGGLGPAFEIGDAFRVRQRLCPEDPWSP